MKIHYRIVGVIILSTALLGIYLHTYHHNEIIDSQIKRMKIIGISMEPTLHNNSYVDIVLNPDKIHRGDIVAFHIQTRGNMVKRVIAVPGDNVMFGKDGFIYINQIKQMELYVRGDKFTEKQLTLLITQLDRYGGKIPNNMYLVLGDNRDASLDSTEYGLIDGDQIWGKCQIN